MINTTKNKNKGIISLVVLLGIGFFAMTTALTISLTSLGELLKNRDTIFGNLAFYTSEANAKEGAYQYIKNPSAYEDCDYGCLVDVLDPINNASIGTILVTSLEWPYAEVKGMAENQISYRENIYTLTVFAEGLAFNYAVFSNNELDFKGSAIVNGNIFANDNIGFSGNNAEINGDAFSAKEIEENNNVKGDIITGVDSIPPPEIDIEPYGEIAENQGTFFTSASDVESYLNNQTKEAVIFVEDAIETTKIQGNNTELSGCLVTMGDLDLTGGTYTATENYPALIVQGNLKIAGGTIINGLVYVMGETSFGGGTNVINGSILSVGDIKTELTGNTTINFDEDLASIWGEIPGLDIISTEKPRIIQWREE